MAQPHSHRQDTQPALASAASRLAVLRPRMPPAAAVAPYLERIDAARWYSNFGPLLREFESRLAARFTDGAQVVTVANGTLGLALLLKARAPEPGLVLMPAWTFVATAHAAILAGHAPLLADVDPQTGALTPEIARDALTRTPGVRAVVAVMPHGAPIDLHAFAALEAQTGVPVIVDAAAAFDVLTEAPAPAVVSLHATKSLGVGEGGFMAVRDAALAERLRALTQFGFAGTRESRFPAMNAKLSEYAAAVGLAALDAWPSTRSRLRRTAQMMRAGLAGVTDLDLPHGWGTQWIGTTCVARTRSRSAEALERQLGAAGVETRRWWGLGLHREPAFAAAARVDDLPTVEALAQSSLGLPFSIDMDHDSINRLIAALADPGQGLSAID